jgi:hypothetical protein
MACYRDSFTFFLFSLIYVIQLSADYMTFGYLIFRFTRHSLCAYCDYVFFQLHPPPQYNFIV